MPAELDELIRRIRQIEIELVSLNKESDERAIKRVAELNEELARLKEKEQLLHSRWSKEKEDLDKSKSLKIELDKIPLLLIGGEEGTADSLLPSHHPGIKRVFNKF